MPRYNATTEGEVACASAATTYIMQVAASASQPIKVRGFAISFDGTSAVQAPVLVKLVRSSTAGSGGTNLTESERDPAGAAASATAVKNVTSPPTPTDELFASHVHPQGGSLGLWFPPGEEPTVPVSTQVNLSVTTDSGVTPNAVAVIYWEE